LLSHRFTIISLSIHSNPIGSQNSISLSIYPKIQKDADFDIPLQGINQRRNFLIGSNYSG